MRKLHENQSGVGRHKCPYCAFEDGYREAMRDINGWVSERLKGPLSF